MAIRTVITRGYGNGTFNGTIALAVTRGYAIGVVTTTALQFYATLDNIYAPKVDLINEAQFGRTLDNEYAFGVDLEAGGQ